MSENTSNDKRSLIVTFKNLDPERLQSILSTQILAQPPNLGTRVRLPRLAKAKALEKAVITDDLAEASTSHKRVSKSVAKCRPAKKPKFKDDSDDAYIENADPTVGHPMPDALLDPESTSMSGNSLGEKTFKPKNHGPKAKTPYYTNATEDKREPEGEPEVWADKRQQLCETLEQYKAYMSGAYYKDYILYGFLVDAKVGDMDFFDHEIIITTAYAFVSTFPSLAFR
jgi:hypothetical protein